MPPCGQVPMSTRTTDPSQRKRTFLSFLSQVHFPEMGEQGLRQLKPGPQAGSPCKCGESGERRRWGNHRNRAGGGDTGKGLGPRFSQCTLPRSLRLTRASGLVVGSLVIR